MLTTRDKPAGRVDDPDLAEKMKAEVEGILLWAFVGLQRLAANSLQVYREPAHKGQPGDSQTGDNNNVYDFLESDGYIWLKADGSISSKELYEIYLMWCDENNLIH